MKGETQRTGNLRTLHGKAKATGENAEEPLQGKAATQSRILQAAGALFLERGFEHTTIADVAEMAGVSRATVFWHFSDKAGLFREAFSALLAPFRNTINENLEIQDPEKRLLGLFAVYDHFVTHQREAIEGFVRWAIESPEFGSSLITSLMDLHQRFTGDLCETLAEIIPPDQDPEALAAGFIALLDGNMLLSFFDNSPQASARRSAGISALAAMVPRKTEPL